MLAATAIPPTRGFYDEFMKVDGVQFALGFMKPGPVWKFGSAASFGSPRGAILKSKVKLGADASAAAGPKGRTAHASTGAAGQRRE